MNSIAARSIAAFPAAAAISPVTKTSQNRTETGGGDALAAMRPAMDAAFAVGAPATSRDAASVLATGGSYISGATRTLDRLDKGIETKQAKIEQLRASDPKAAEQEQGQLDMLERLRDRIQLSIERVGDILAGKDRDDIGSDGADAGPSKASTSREDERREQLKSLEQRRQLLAPSISGGQIGVPNAALVAGQYSAASTTPF
ncbi:MAG: hypothetical protein ABI200_05645 [Gaiellales bacterium]